MTIDTETARRRLTERRHQLISRYQGTIERVNEELESREIEMVENAQEQWDSRFLTMMGDTDARALEAVVGALRRLDEGRYGVCVQCGEAIDPARLEALPEAALCVRCADAQEQPTAPPMPGV